MQYIICALFILVASVFRLVPHPPNFTPMLSIAILSGLYLENKYAILVPIMIMLVTDIFIGFHISMYWVYISLLLIFLIGKYLTKNSLISIASHSVSSSILFFILTNFGVWIMGGYSYTLNGLVLCYTMAIPFFINTLAGTLLFSISGYFVLFYLKKFAVNRNLKNIY